MASQIASLFASIGADPGPAKTGLGDVKAKLQELKGDFDKTKLVAQMILRDEATEAAKKARAEIDKMTEAEKKAAVESYALSEAQKDVAAAEAKHAASAESVGDKLAKFGLAIQGAQSLVNVFGDTWNKAMDFGRAGAELEQTKTRFDRLSASIGTTSESLSSKLAAAMGGMASNAEIMAGANQMISLGLAKDEESVVRLATVVNKLGWDMQQVILTFANNSTMRLDALGLSIEDVTGRAKELEAQGYSTDKAFDMAVIEAGEKKIKLLGDSSESSVGSFKRMDAALKDIGDTVKLAFAPGIANAAEAVNLLITANGKIQSAMKQHEGSVAATAETYGDFVTEMLRAKMVTEGFTNATVEDARNRMAAWGGDVRVVAKEIGSLSEEQYNQARAANSAKSSDVAMNDALRAQQQEARAANEAMGLYADTLDGGVLPAEQTLTSFIEAANSVSRERRDTMASITDAAIRMTDEDNKRAEIEGKLIALDKEITTQGAVKSSSYVTLQGTLGGYTEVIGFATEAQLQQRDALRDTLDEMQRTAEIEAAKSAFDALAKSLTEGNLSESEYLDITKRLNDEVGLYTEKAFNAATSAVLLNTALGKTDSADAAWQAIMKYGDGLGRAIGLQQQLSSGQGAPATPTGMETMGGERMARGGSFIVPPGYPADSYQAPLRLTSGERVDVTPAGQSNNNSYGGAVTINVNDPMTGAIVMNMYKQQQAGRLNSRMG